ncbi:hypothetical protein SYK_28060 [Pseudodesulfovibrio nedwellii]|uniref:Type II secretion system protein K n=1 Tax=Pseudodesulfovibrio nedwellii TaxID=2973072 RepID=A0ABM8B480_9BACT|nr:type II secretion system protein GspK [Pseudodesulfovibrio nedwellii]BDQ38446.1 hypothetical protein SYK_28060 [Pseudodesulfovibrio nedwellii]
MRHQNKDGSVLIVVLLVLAAAAFLILESGKFLRIDYSSAAYQRVVVAGGSLLRSGLTVAKEILLEDIKDNGNSADHKFDNWANIEVFYDEISASLESGDISGRIIPEDGRIHLNSFRAGNDVGKDLGEIFVRLVEGLCSAHGIEADSNIYLKSIKIWLGEKDTQGDKDWYAGQEPAFISTNGPFRAPDELLLVRWEGVEPEDIRKVFYGANGIPGLRKFITVWSSGKINVNIAEREVIAAMIPNSELSAEFVEAVENYRNEGANDFSLPWYKGIAMRVGGDMSNFPDKALASKSSVFRVLLTATIGAGHLNSTTILRRDSKRCVVLFENIH